MKTVQNKKGFTLIELLIVIAIIGLLATLAIVSLTTAQQKARDTKRVADLKQLQNAVELYYSENSEYPTSEGKTWATFGTAIGSYITNIPQDPTNTGTKVYTYATNGTVALTTDDTQYVIKAELENPSFSALAGDDDVVYNSTTPPSGWTATYDPAASGTTNPAIGATVDCDEATSAGAYCVSE